MKTITCVAVDDEPIALDIIRTFSESIPQLDLHCFNSPAQARQYLRENRVELLFLDIHMPEMMGFEIAAEVNKLPYIIFTTGYAEYAIESYEYNTLGYLLKPYDFERFEKAVSKALELLQELETKVTIPVKIDYRNVLIAAEDILYIEALGNYIKIYTKKKTYLPQMKMKEAEALLPTPQFKRIHRSYIINTDALDSFTKTEAIVAGVSLPISKSYADSLVTTFP